MSENKKIGVVTYDVGVLGAELKLTALLSRQGKMIREGLSWQLESCVKADNDEPKIYTSDEAQTRLLVTPGSYRITATLNGEAHELGEAVLSQNTSVDAVFIFSNGEIGTDDEYFVDYDGERDFSRRSEERDAQSQYGAATLPLRDPNPPQGDMGAQFMAHPLLQLPQFDGVPPDMRPDPSENREALQLTLAQKLAAAPAAVTTPTPGPNR